MRHVARRSLARGRGRVRAGSSTTTCSARSREQHPGGRPAVPAARSAVPVRAAARPSSAWSRHDIGDSMYEMLGRQRPGGRASPRPATTACSTSRLLVTMRRSVTLLADWAHSTPPVARRRSRRPAATPVRRVPTGRRPVPSPSHGRATFHAPKGTQDVLPPESARWEALLAAFAQTRSSGPATG